MTAWSPAYSAFFHQSPLPMMIMGYPYTWLLVICYLFHFGCLYHWHRGQNLSIQGSSEVLTSHEKTTKKKYLAPCCAQWHHFTPFIVSTDGLLGHEAEAVVCQMGVARNERLPVS